MIMNLFFIFQNPFLHRRDTTITSPSVSHSSSLTTPPRFHIGRSGRSNSAPGRYDSRLDKQMSIDSGLESVEEVNIEGNVVISEERR